MTDRGLETDGVIEPGAVVGNPDGEGRPDVGRNPTIRSGTIIYADVTIGDDFVTGHNALVREDTEIGDDVLVGTATVVDGTSRIGDRVRMQTGVYVPTHTVIDDDVFLGPNATLTNDPYPLRRDAALEGPTLAADATVGANATVLPGVHVGERAFVAAGAVVVDDVPSDTLAVGAPARHRPLPPELDGGNATR